MDAKDLKTFDDIYEWEIDERLHFGDEDEWEDFLENGDPNVYHDPSCSNIDDVERPFHYVHYSIEPKEFIIRNKMPFWKGNVVKYVSRAGHKTYDNETLNASEILDLRKAIRYCEMRINMLNDETNL